MVTLGQLVQKEHLLRQLDQHTSFDFFRDATPLLPWENDGRLVVDLVGLFKMLIIGYLFGICSE